MACTSSPLAAIADAELIAPTIAQILGVGSASERSLFERLKSFFANKLMLLLLDNFEQVIAGAVTVVDLLAACPDLKIMVTSREPLRVRGEYEFSVPPLMLPDPEDLSSLEALSQNASFALFVQRAQAANALFQVSSANARAIAQLCVRLEGLPLAIELAAAHSKLLPPATLLKRLSHRLHVLTGGARDLPERQQTLRNTMRWSYELLDSREQCLFRRLSVFAGGCSLEAAEAVCLCDGVDYDVLEKATSLINKSLLLQKEQLQGEPRLMMLETIREYGLECLEAQGEADLLRRAHADYFLALAEEAELQVSGTEQALWLDRLELENDNLRAALYWLIEWEDMEKALRLASALWWFWFLRGYQSEGRQWLDRALSGSEKVATEVLAKALGSAGMLANAHQDDHERAAQLFRESLVLYSSLADKRNVAITSWRLGFVSWYRHEYATARALAEQVLPYFRQVGDLSFTADTLLLLAYTWVEQGDYQYAHPLIEEALALFERGGDEWGQAYTLHRLSYVTFSLGEVGRAQALAEKSIAIARKLGSKNAHSYALLMLTRIGLAQHDMRRAEAHAQECLAILKETGDRYGTIETLCLLARIKTRTHDVSAAYSLYQRALDILREIDDSVLRAQCLEGLAETLALSGRAALAARFLGLAEALREELSIPVPAADRDYLSQVQQLVASHLGTALFTASLKEGKQMRDVDATHILAQLSTGANILPAQSPVAAPQGHGAVKPQPQEHLSFEELSTTIQAGSSLAEPGLTPREVEVLRLLAVGMTNVQIASKLSISSLTVNAHVRSIFNKLDVTSRSAATRYAIEHKLV